MSYLCLFFAFIIFHMLLCMEQCCQCLSFVSIVCASWCTRLSVISQTKNTRLCSSHLVNLSQYLQTMDFDQCLQAPKEALNKIGTLGISSKFDPRLDYTEAGEVVLGTIRVSIVRAWWMTLLRTPLF